MKPGGVRVEGIVDDIMISFWQVFSCPITVHDAGPHPVFGPAAGMLPWWPGGGGGRAAVEVPGTFGDNGEDRRTLAITSAPSGRG
jgi:hypothetical protein